MQFFYRKETFQIDAVYRGCKTNSGVFKDGDKYVEVNVENPPYEVSRDHKVILGEGKVVGTEPNVNPVQPTPSPIEVPESMELKSKDGTVWMLTVDKTGKVSANKKTVSPEPI